MELPYDCVEAIMSRLPVKSLQRFKSVSNTWNGKISDPSFIRMHDTLSMNSDSRNLFIQYSSNRFSLVRLKGRNFEIETVLENPHAGEKYKHLLSVADGLTLLRGHGRGYTKFLLHNPCSRQHRILVFPYKLNNYPNTYGMCNDPSNDDFKVVLSFENFYAVFSCKNNSWTKKKEFFYNNTQYDYAEIHGERGGISVDGAMYWSWTNIQDELYWIYKILFFDPRDDEFKILPKPVEDSVPFLLTSLKGRLCLYCNIEDDETTVKIWIKEEGGPDKVSWEVLMKIENLPKPAESLVLLPFEENKILIDLDGKRFRIYDTCGMIYEEFKEREGMGQLFPCFDGLFFPVIKSKPKRKRKQSG